MNSAVKIRAVILALLCVGLASLKAEDIGSLNRQLDQQIRGLKRTALKRVEKSLGLEPSDADAIRIEFQDLPPALAKERRIRGSRLVENEDGSFTVVLYREFARAGLVDLEGETTYQLARATWRQLYPDRAKVAAWFLHGMALHASGLGDDRIRAIIADNERRTTEIADGWEAETTHNERDQADDLLLFRFVEEDGENNAITAWLQAVAKGAEPHRVIGDVVPGGFRNLEKRYMKRAKEVIDELAEAGLKEFRGVYDAYQEANTAGRAKMTGAFLKVIGRHRDAFWEGKARYYLGMCWLAADREEKALAEFNRVLGDLARRSDPRFVDMAKYKLGGIFMERNRISRALQTWEEYLRDYTWGKYQAEARLDLAEHWMDKRQNKKARPLLQWILDNEPDSSHGKKAAKLLKGLS